MGKSPAVAPWTNRDSALWHTCEIVADLSQGRYPQSAPQVLTSFLPTLGPEEALWASGPFQLFDYQPIGDGSYVHNSGWFFATGAAGLMATAAIAAARAAGNNSRRASAAAAAQPRWVPIDWGTLHTGSHGVYLHTPTALLTWGWPSFTSMSMMAPGTVHLNGNSDRGQVSWILEADWAELVFVLWAVTVHPRHPQLVNGEWLPPGWLERAMTTYPTRLRSPALALPGR